MNRLASQTTWASDKPLYILAPMEAVTDTVFRQVVATAAKPDVFFSEFTNATGWTHAGEKAIAGRLDISNPAKEQPLIAQIWGSNPQDIEELSAHCAKLGYDGIDINMGCPEKTAIKSGGGAAMCLSPELAGQVIAAAKNGAGKLPISVKCRLGYSRLDEWANWLGFLLDQQVTALTVHLRTKKEMSKVPAHWEIMSDIKTLRDQISPETKLIGNGDVQDCQHGRYLIDQYEIDGVMIGRGIFSNIFAFEKSPKQHSAQEYINLLLLHLKLFDQHAKDRSAKFPDLKPKPYQTLKRFFKIYIREFEGSHELRNDLMDTDSTAQAIQLLNQFTDKNLADKDS